MTSAEALAERRRRILRAYAVMKMHTIEEIATQLKLSKRTAERDLAWVRENWLGDERMRAVAREYFLESLAVRDAVMQEAWRIHLSHSRTTIVKGEIVQMDDDYLKLAALKTIETANRGTDRLLALLAPALIEKLTALIKMTDSPKMMTIERLTFSERLRAGAEELLHDRPELEAEGYVPITDGQT